MRFSVALPTDRIQYGDEFLGARAIREVAQAAEAAGYDACFVTDHPYPVQRWLEGGGHHALDPFVALSFAASGTERLRLQTHVLVLPYRNPFLAAKSALSLDVLSGGRVILGAAAGYLRGEFQALGVDFDLRNELSDEAIVAMKRAWTEEDVQLEGRHFNARGNTMLPHPPQKPHPPIWVGGNSKRAIRRAIELAEGWVPFTNTAAMAPFTRSASLETDDDLISGIAYARTHAEKVGRTTPYDICFSLEGDAAKPSEAETCDRVARLAEHGVTWLTVGFPATTRAAYVERLQRFAEEVVSKSR
jgi:probable F420-dependent oxidoreductase